MLGKSVKEIIIPDYIKVVSFDMYDTMIYRKVNKPEDVFKIVEKKFNTKSDTKISF